MAAKYDVAVVGGGPAGLAAALSVNAKGFKVAVLEAGEPPRDKACGEGLLPDALHSLGRLGIPIHPEDGGVFRGIRFVDGHTSVFGAFPSGTGIGLRRTSLHAKLARRAQEAGVDLVWGCPVRELRDHKLVGRKLSLEARWIIGADGIHSQVRRWSGLDQHVRSDERVAFRRHYSVPPASQAVEIHWNSVAQCYVTPVSSNETGVAIISRDRNKRFEELLDSFPSLTSRYSKDAACSDVRGCLTASRKLRRVHRGHVALVGDASGSVDAITGEGICLALLQAEALAEALVSDDLAFYARRHNAIMRRPSGMAALLLFLGAHQRCRQRVMRALSKQPEAFEKMISFHIGAAQLHDLGIRMPLSFGYRLLFALPTGYDEALR